MPLLAELAEVFIAVKPLINIVKLHIPVNNISGFLPKQSIHANTRPGVGDGFDSWKVGYISTVSKGLFFLFFLDKGEQSDRFVSQNSFMLVPSKFMLGVTCPKKYCY